METISLIKITKTADENQVVPLLMICFGTLI